MRGKTLSIPKVRNINEDVESLIEDVHFTVHKFNNRDKPSDTRNIVIFPCFSEFGTEILGTLYCLPMMMQQKFQGKYSIAVGWYGRTFLYKYLVDEFWELNEEHQWLRKYCRAFHHYSKNLANIEKKLKKLGRFVEVLEIGNVATYPKLNMCLLADCGGDIKVFDTYQQCQKCKLLWPALGLFSDPAKYKKEACWPIVSEEKKALVSKYLKPNSVGVTARNRDAYGRNLPSIFYERLLYILEDMGYNPIWIGEKSTTLSCPLSRITDFSITEDSKDLENTLALVSQLKFTIQFWTASTRLAGMVGTSFLIMESFDQIYGGSSSPGHEGFRMYLCTKGDKKLILAHYNDIANNHNIGLQLVKQAISEMEVGNFEDIQNS